LDILVKIHAVQLNKKIILASRSPRRAQLLREAGFSFEVWKVENNEEYHGNLPAVAVAKFLAEQKAKQFDIIQPHEIVITADTIVVINDIILGKPDDRAGAISMLSSLSGKMHHVITGVCLKGRDKIHSFDDTTRVYFKRLTDDEIGYYVDHFKPYDKAGAYGIQEWIGMIGISRIEGSYFNVVGLPVHKVYDSLLKF
jgi:septum formation protein